MAKEFIQYTIKYGDTIEKLAKKHNITMLEIIKFNPGLDPFALLIGDKIQVSV